MRRLPALLLAGALVGTAPLVAASPADAATTVPVPLVVTQATTSDLGIAPYADAATFPVFDAAGRQTGTRSWRLTKAGGNCCEVYVDSTADGQLLEFGGTYPQVSSDGGVSWTRVSPVTPLQNGEGAIVSAPDGSIYGVGWDAYTGDHLQGFRYDPATKTWSVSEMTLHSPFYDRPWITYAKGPFTLDGVTYPAITVVRGAYPFKEPVLVSGDGLHYTTLSSPYADEQSAGTAVTTALLDVTPDPGLDYGAPHMGAGTTPLPGGGLLEQRLSGDLGDCELHRLDPTSGLWRCYAVGSDAASARTFDGPVRADSRGWLHEAAASADGTTITFATSADGGASWQQVVLTPPGGGALVGGDVYDMKVNGAQGAAVVAARFERSDGSQQDMAFHLDVSSATPRLVETLYVGLGDLSSGSDVSGSAGDRMDYASVAILPTGEIAMSFDDSTTTQPSTRNPNAHNPALAVQTAASPGFEAEPPAVTPEAPLAALLPLVALAVGGLVVVRRRRGDGLSTPQRA